MFGHPLLLFLLKYGHGDAATHFPFGASTRLQCGLRKEGKEDRNGMALGEGDFRGVVGQRIVEFATLVCVGQNILDSIVRLPPFSISSIHGGFAEVDLAQLRYEECGPDHVRVAHAALPHRVANGERYGWLSTFAGCRFAIGCTEIQK